MTWLITTGLANAVLVTPLAALAFVVGRWSRRPALAHVLWVVVLIKLLTPPLVEIPVGCRIDPQLWTAGSTAGGDSSLSTQVAQAEAPERPASLLLNFPSAAPDLATQEFAPATSDPQPTRRLPSEHGKSSLSLSAAAVVNNPHRAGRDWSFAWSPLVWARSLAAIWLLGAVAMAALLAQRAWRFHRFLTVAARADERLNARAAQLCRAAGISRPVPVLVVASAVSPLLWGVGRGARLVFPARLVERLGERACDSLLLHELAHYSRGDHWVRLVELAVQVLYWWHPVVWWARYEIEAAEEQCCDAWVIEHQEGSRRSYAEALLSTIDFLCDEPLLLPPAACGLGEVPLLKCRLTQIMRGEIATRLSPGLKALVAGAALVILPLGPALFAASSRPVIVSLPNSIVAKVEAEASAAPRDDSPSGRLETPEDAAKDSEPAAAPHTPTEPAASAEPPRVPAVLWASATSPGGKYRLEARTGRKATLVHVEPEWRLDLSSYRITCVSFAADGRTFATGHEDRVVRLWDSESGGVLASFKGCDAEITSVALARTGGHLAAGDADGRVVVWNVATGEETAHLARQNAPIRCVRWSSRADRLAICVGDWSDREHAALLVWSPAENVLLAEHALGDPPAAVDWLAGDRTLVVGAWDGSGQLVHVETGEALQQVDLGKDLVSAAAWSPDCPLVPRWLAERLIAGAE